MSLNSPSRIPYLPHYLSNGYTVDWPYIPYRTYFLTLKEMKVKVGTEDKGDDQEGWGGGGWWRNQRVKERFPLGLLVPNVRVMTPCLVFLRVITDSPRENLGLQIIVSRFFIYNNVCPSRSSIGLQSLSIFTSPVLGPLRHYRVPTSSPSSPCRSPVWGERRDPLFIENVDPTTTWRQGLKKGGRRSVK